VYAGTSATFMSSFGEPSRTAPGVLHKLVDVVCDECGVKAITFSKDGPDGWTQRYRWWRTSDLCPECSAKPEPPGDGSTYA
jgi:hypothetical protein